MTLLSKVVRRCQQTIDGLCSGLQQVGPQRKMPVCILLLFLLLFENQGILMFSSLKGNIVPNQDSSVMFSIQVKDRFLKKHNCCCFENNDNLYCDFLFERMFRKSNILENQNFSYKKYRLCRTSSSCEINSQQHLACRKR